MCTRKQQYATIDELERRLGATIRQSDLFKFDEDFGFDHNPSPIVKSESPETISTDYRWGLIPPTWNKDPKDIWNGTLNAKLEEVDDKYAFKSVTRQRCLIPATAYFEHHWNDSKGKSKTKYIIHHSDVEIFTLAGFYAEWISKHGERFHTYTIATTRGNETMRFVHNKDAQIDYHRMPVMLNPEDEKSWLDLRIDCQEFNFPNYQPRLIAMPCDGQLSLI